MASAKNIISINVSRNTRGVSRQGFGVPLFIGISPSNWADGEVVRSYTTSDGVLEDFGSDTPEYIAASRFFGQNPSPRIVKIGRHVLGVTSIDFTVSVNDGDTYTINLDDTDVEFTAPFENTTAEDIVTGLQSAFNSATAQGTFIDKGDGTFNITPSNLQSYTLTTSTNLLTSDVSESLTEAIKKIREQDGEAYFLTAYTRDSEDIMELAEYIETQKMMYVFSVKPSDAGIPNITTDIGSRLQLRAMSRTVPIYAEDPTEYPECAIVGKQAPKDPGSTTWKFKEVSGVTASNLSDNFSLILKGDKYTQGKGYNTYEPTGGRNIFAEGRASNGEFIDVIRFADWLEARMRERIFLTLLNSEKIPFTSAGFGIIEGRMREVLNLGITVGGISSYTVDVPNPRAADPNERANRVATGFRFSAILQGAVHFVEIQGSLEI